MFQLIITIVDQLEFIIDLKITITTITLIITLIITTLLVFILDHLWITQTLLQGHQVMSVEVVVFHEEVILTEKINIYK